MSNITWIDGTKSAIAAHRHSSVILGEGLVRSARLRGRSHRRPLQTSSDYWIYPSTYPASWKDFKKIYAQDERIVGECSELASSEFAPERAIAALKALGNPSETALLLVPDGEVSKAQENAFKLIEANAGQYPIVGS